jgi:hypothetical protein
MPYPNPRLSRPRVSLSSYHWVMTKVTHQTAFSQSYHHSPLLKRRLSSRLTIPPFFPLTASDPSLTQSPLPTDQATRLPMHPSKKHATIAKLFPFRSAPAHPTLAQGTGWPRDGPSFFAPRQCVRERDARSPESHLTPCLCPTQQGNIHVNSPNHVREFVG